MSGLKNENFESCNGYLSYFYEMNKLNIHFLLTFDIILSLNLKHNSSKDTVSQYVTVCTLKKKMHCRVLKNEQS